MGFLVENCKWWVLSVGAIFLLLINPSFADQENCQKKIEEILGGIEPAQFEKFSAEKNIISLNLVYMHKNLNEKIPSSCKKQVATALNQVEVFFHRRLQWLLKNRNSNLFYQEFELLMEPYFGKKRFLFSVSKFESEREGYLNLLKEELLQSLISTQWSSYTEIPLSIEPWSKEWESFLNTDAPAAVNLNEHRVAVDWIQLNPDEIKIFLFHELSHLKGKELFIEDEFKNEEYAWQQTFEYISHLETKGNLVPKPLLKAKKMATGYGLSNWVRLLVLARTNPLH